MTTPVPVSRPVPTGDALIVEACLWALEGLSVASIARVLDTSHQTVSAALKKSGGWFLVYPGAGKRKRQTFWFFPEADRKRIGMGWERCVLTGAEMLIWGDFRCTPVDKSTIRSDDPRVTSWQRETPDIPSMEFDVHQVDARSWRSMLGARLPVTGCKRAPFVRSQSVLRIRTSLREIAALDPMVVTINSRASLRSPAAARLRKAYGLGRPQGVCSLPRIGEDQIRRAGSEGEIAMATIAAGTHAGRLWVLMTLATGLVVQGPTAVPVGAQGTGSSVPVTVTNFVRAESDLYFGRYVKRGAFGKFTHDRQMTPINKQDVVRLNRDTLYSAAVFDLEAAPVTITLPDAGKRFMSMQVISQDHYTTEVVYAPGRYTYNKHKVGTRYVIMAVRTLANPENPDDMKAAHAAQDGITFEQASIGKFQVPNWDLKLQDKLRQAINGLAPYQGATALAQFGTNSEVDPVLHLIGTVTGWGGDPRTAVVYEGVYPKANNGKVVHNVTLKDVPVDGFWSISLYNAKGYFEKNTLDAYSFSNLTAQPNPDGSYTIQFGGCQKETPNCLPIMAGWNYTVRLYRPREEVVDGTWKLPEAQP